MSGPIRPADAECEDEALRGVEVREGRRAEVGGLPIARVLPTKGRRTVGPWCFVDLMGPEEVLDPDPMEVGPHPHTGLSTVTWLLSGEALHTDSLGTEQVIRPGQLNLMTAGRGIAHAELGTPDEATRGVQMWLAQPDATRNGANAFEHHGDLPRLALDGAEVALLVGGLGEGPTSPARQDHPTVGAQLDLRAAGGVEVPLDATFEHGLVPLDGPVLVAGQVVEVGSLALVPAGAEVLPLEVRTPGRAMLLGGAPLGEDVKMWWNFVARTTDEITAAWRAWRDHDTDRFGPVPSILDRIDAPTPPWVRTP